MFYKTRNQIEFSACDCFSLQKECNCSSSFAKLLFSRGLDSKETLDKFLNPSLEMDSPWLLSDMKEAVGVIQKAIIANKKICVYGDYDVDGVCATVILLKTLLSMGIASGWYIPDRRIEGFGMNLHAIDKIYQEGYSLIITVDNGISACAEIEYAASLGIDVVVTDHHRFTILPKDARAIVSPSREGYSSTINDLSGAGVAWMLARALTGKPLENFLPFVALAIAADSVDVTHLNRQYLIKSFPLIKKEPHFASILKKAQVFDDVISMFTLNFILAPRINACGRMAHANEAVSFFMTDNPIEIESISDKIESLNTARKKEQERIQKECESIIGSQPERSVLVLFGEDWNTGVVGIVAQKLVDKYHKNTIILSKTQDGLYTGSGRSNGKTDLFALLSRCSEVIDRYGGHAGAAGLIVLPEQKDAFSNLICHIYESQFASFERDEFLYDTDLCHDDCTSVFLKEIQKLAPFGNGNPEPVFRVPITSLSDLKLIGKSNEHISGVITLATEPFRLVAFGLGTQMQYLQSLKCAEVLVRLSENTFRGKSRVELICIHVQDVCSFAEDQTILDLFDAFSGKIRYNKQVLLQKAIESNYFTHLSVVELRKLYIVLKDRFQKRCTDNVFLSGGTSKELTALLIFAELGFIKLINRFPVFENNPPKRNCSESDLYTLLNKNN